MNPPELELKIRFGKDKLVLLAAVAVSVFLWSACLGLSNISLLELMDIGQLGGSLGKLLSPFFILFLLLFPLTFALIMLLGRQHSKREIELFSLVGAAIGLLVSLAIFWQSLANLALLIVFYLAGLFLGIELAAIKLEELKKFIMARTIGQSVKKICTVVSIGLFVAAALTGLEHKAELAGSLEKELLSSLAGAEEGVGKAGADLLIDTQKQLIKQITEETSYGKLGDKSDADVQAFVAEVETLKATISSPEYREEVEAEMAAGTSELDLESALKEIKGQVPLLALIEEYYWLFAALAILGIFSFLAGAILAPLGMAYGFALEKIIK